MLASGSMRAARSAGSAQAASATTIITATAATNLAASVAVSPKSRSAMTLALTLTAMKAATAPPRKARGEPTVQTNDTSRRTTSRKRSFKRRIAS
jgi:hypothetical protein